VHSVEVFSSVNSSRSDSRARPVNSSVASGNAMTEKITFRDRWRSNERNLKRDTWRASGGGVQCDRTLCPRPVRSTGASGQHDSSSTLFLTALFFEVAYKYVFGRFGEDSLGHFDSLTSS
jgi:hypothetical protein